MPGKVFHLLCAAIGFVLLSHYSAWTSVFCLWLTFRREKHTCADEGVNKSVRVVIYGLIWLLSMFAPILFVVWMTDVTKTILEWIAVSTLYMAILPNFYFFAVARKNTSHYHPIQ
jgi:peptidoglycan biosynthesis protein MviN/MurJ (putative lipid II flippase)